MKFSQGTRKSLGKRDHNIQDVIVVIERLEEAVPHFHFSPWRAERTEDATHPAAPEVTWASSERTQMKVALGLRQGLRLWSTCEIEGSAIPKEDHRFLNALAEEATQLLTASYSGNMSLFEFGTLAVAAEIRLRADLEESPVGVIRFLRSLAQESYENQRISYGVILSADVTGFDSFSEAFDNKRAKRLTDGFSTALILDARLRIAGYAALAIPDHEGERLPRRPWWCSGLATASHRLNGIGIVLVRSGDMLVVHNGRLLFSLRAGKWRIWSHAAILGRMESAWNGRGHPGEIRRLLRYLYHVALDLSFRRSGGLLIIMARRERLAVLLSSRTDQVGARGRGAAEKALDRMLESNRLQNIDRRIVTDLASLDGALVVDRSGRTLAYGAMTRTAGGARQGARARAAIASSREGLAIKVSSDGNISLFARGESVMEL